MSKASKASKAARPHRDLSLDEIVARAGELARREGSGAVTMRAVATACGVTPMALYHHVANKDALLDLMVDRVVAGALAEIGTERTWREELTEFLCRLRRRFLANETAAEVFLRRPVVSENLARWTEFLFQSFEQAGLKRRAVPEAADAVVLLVVGAISNDLSRPPAVRQGLADALPKAEAPRLSRYIEAYSARDGEARFRRALDWLLDGLLADARQKQRRR